jgi:hypothetical protein
MTCKLALVALLAAAVAARRSAGAEARMSETLAFTPLAATYVDAARPHHPCQGGRRLRAAANPARIIYLRFAIGGVGDRLVERARLRLQVRGTSAPGGAVHLLADTGWDATTLTYANRPAVDGSPVVALGRVRHGAVVEFDLDGALTGDGTYTLAIDSRAGRGVTYLGPASRRGQKPVLVLTVGGPAPPQAPVDPAPADNTAPLVVITAPDDDQVVPAGGEVRLRGRADDREDGELSPRMTWSSDRDGELGQGGELSAVLSPGHHKITARATDGSGLEGTATVSVAVAADALVAPGVIAEAATGNVGLQDFGFGANIDESDNRATAHKPQSKLWYNDGIWWATLFDPSGAGGHRIHALDPVTQRWVSTGVLVDERGKSRQDVLWDGQKLYVASQFGYTGGSPKQNRLLRFTYLPSAKTYLLDTGFPVNIPGGGTEALTLAKDSTGTLWIAYTLSNRVFVANSVGGNDTQWSTPFVVPVSAGTTVDSDDIAGVVALQGKIGVFWSNQATTKDYFAVHTDGASPTSASAWTEEIAGQGGAFADDHMNLKLAGDGRLFAAVKTSYTSSSDTLVGLLVRSRSGVWSPLYPVDTVSDDPTRPQCFLDEGRGLVYVFYSYNHAAIYYKASSMNTIAFPSGAGTPFIKNSSVTDINNVTGTKQNVSTSTGLLVVASSPSTTSYWHNWIAPTVTTTTTTLVSTTTITGPPTTTTTTTSTTTTTTLPSTLTFSASADTYVDQSSPAKIFGTASRLKAGTSPVRQAFLRFTVSGIGSRTVTQVVLRLTVGSNTSAKSNSGGTIHRITSNSWSEATTNYNNRPPIDGAGLATLGAVASKQVVDFNVTAAVTANGTYNFALDSASTDTVEYQSREASSGAPQLIVRLAP